MVKHLAWVELEYFGEVFGRPHGLGSAPDHDVPNSDMYARADESRAEVLELFAGARTHAVATIDALDLDAHGHVPWWGDVNPVSLEWVIVHMIAEINRHLGQIDVLREELDGLVGHREGVDNLPDVETGYWPEHVAKLEAIAREAAASPE